MRRAQVNASVPIIDRLALIGVGLIGGSIARAAREYGAVREIVATGRSEATRRRPVCPLKGRSGTIWARDYEAPPK